jgi:hypothetical protein
MGAPRGRQTAVRAPGAHPPKRRECAAADWRTGATAGIRGEKRDAATFCGLLGACPGRSPPRKRRVVRVADRARIHPKEGSRPARGLLERAGRRRLRDVPLYSPGRQPMEKSWNDWRDNATHNHGRLRIEDLEGDGDHDSEERARDPAGVLRTISRPFAKRREDHRTWLVSFSPPTPPRLSPHESRTGMQVARWMI